MFNRIHAQFLALWNDSLHRNSFYLIFSQLILAFLGFLFWIFNTKIFTSDQIGIAATLISVFTLLTTLSQIGFNTATIGYLPREEDKNKFVNTSFFFVSLAAVFISTIFILTVSYFSKPLEFLRESTFLAIFFVCSVVISSVNAITDSVFIALRNTKYVLMVNTIVAVSKLIFPVLLVSLGSLGIFYANALAVLCGMIFSLVFIHRAFAIQYSFRPDLNIIRKVWRFSSSSYVANVIGMISSTIAPILILNRLGASASAFYYMPTMIVNLMYTIPRSVSSSMLAEGSSEGTHLLKLGLKSLGSMYSLLIPGILFTAFIGKYVLLMFGKEYSSEGTSYLTVTALSLLLVAPNYVFGTILNIRKESKFILAVSIVNSVGSILFLLYFIRFGLIGVAVSSIITQVTLSFFYVITLLRITKKGR